MWWWVIAAFVMLIGMWVTIITLSQTHKVEVIEMPKDAEVAPSAESAPESP